MTNMLQVRIIAVAAALLGSSGSTLARPAHHHRPAARHSRLAPRSQPLRHDWSVYRRRMRGGFVLRAANRLPARQHRVYFATAAEARSASHHWARSRRIPVKPRLTWKGTRHLPSIGTHHAPPPPPKEMRKPLAPPGDQQPLVTPTQPMPN